MQKILMACILTFLSLIILGIRSVYPPHIASFAVMGAGVGLLAFLGKQRELAYGIWMGAALYAMVFFALYYLVGPQVFIGTDQPQL